MAAKAILIVCAQALLAKFALSQCFGQGILGTPITARGFDRFRFFDRLSCGGTGSLTSVNIAPNVGIGPTSGGSFTVVSSSAIPPTGLRVISENILEGTLAVIGNLPFLGAVTTDGAFPSTGIGAISYGCGDGYFGITAISTPNMAPGLGFAKGIPPFGLSYKPGCSLGYRTKCGCGF